MAEHARQSFDIFVNGKPSETVHQYCDVELCRIVDIISNDSCRFGRHKNKIGTIDEAIEYLKKHSYTDRRRCVIIKLNCIQAFVVNPESK
jgi:hypothetical protein